MAAATAEAISFSVGTSTAGRRTPPSTSATSRPATGATSSPGSRRTCRTRSCRAGARTPCRSGPLRAYATSAAFVNLTLNRSPATSNVATASAFGAGAASAGVTVAAGAEHRGGDECDLALLHVRPLGNAGAAGGLRPCTCPRRCRARRLPARGTKGCVRRRARRPCPPHEARRGCRRAGQEISSAGPVCAAVDDEDHECPGGRHGAAHGA
jgi:hypothetical protein